MSNGGAAWRLMRDAKLPRLSLHGRRHSCATAALGRGRPPHVLAAMLGQDVKVLLSTYADVLAEQEDDCAAALAQAPSLIRRRGMRPCQRTNRIRKRCCYRR